MRGNLLVSKQFLYTNIFLLLNEVCGTICTQYELVFLLTPYLRCVGGTTMAAPLTGNSNRQLYKDSNVLSNLSNCKMTCFVQRPQVCGQFCVPALGQGGHRAEGREGGDGQVLLLVWGRPL